jgi:hypothetical protein
MHGQVEAQIQQHDKIVAVSLRNKPPAFMYDS